MKKILVFLFLFVSLVSSAQDNRFECDDTCSPEETGQVTYNVVSPVGFSTVEPIIMAPRLNTLDGKTIAIVGEDFMYTTSPILLSSSLSRRIIPRQKLSCMMNCR